jgi:hypothetical protein
MRFRYNELKLVAKWCFKSARCWCVNVRKWVEVTQGCSCSLRALSSSFTAVLWHCELRLHVLNTLHFFQNHWLFTGKMRSRSVTKRGDDFQILKYFWHKAHCIEIYMIICFALILLTFPKRFWTLLSYHFSVFLMYLIFKYISKFLKNPFNFIY